MTRIIKVFAPFSAFLAGFFCCDNAFANIKEYHTEVALDLIERSAKDKQNSDLSLQADESNFTITLPKVEIANRKSKAYTLKNDLDHNVSLTFDCDNGENVVANLKFNSDSMRPLQAKRKDYRLEVSPILTINYDLINKTGIKTCKITDELVALADLINYGTNSEFKINVTLKINPYISIINRTIDAELSKQNNGDYTKQVEIPVKTNANNIKLTLSSCTHLEGNTCQLKHKDTKHKIPIHIHDNNGNNEVMINQAIIKSQLSTIDNKFILDLTTNKDDMNHAKAGEYKGTIKLKLEASF